MHDAFLVRQFWSVAAWLAAGLLCGHVAALLASAKRRSVPRWFALGFFFSVFAVVLAALLPTRPREERAAPRAFGPELLRGYAYLVTYSVLGICAFFTIIPLVWLVCAAFKSQSDILAYPFLPLDRGASLGQNLGLLHDKLTTGNFHDLFVKFNFARNLLNSFFLTCVGVSVSLLLSALGGFALAKYDFTGKRPLMLLMLGTMMIPGAVLLAPTYELFTHLRLVDNYVGLLLPGAVSAFGMLLFRQAMLHIPDDLLEAARIDGCSELRIWWEIVLPVVRPMSGAFCLMSFMALWNSFMWPMIMLQSEDLFTVPIALNQTIGLSGDNLYGLMMSGTLLGVLPPAILFFLLQKEFIAGLTAGAVKG
jgi:multiple sugar transport system permease protein